jgi:hypothetical protein
MITTIFEYLKKVKQEVSSVIAKEDIFMAAINGDNTQFNLLREKQEYYQTNSKTNFSFISKFYAACYSGFKKINFFNRNKPPLNIMLKRAVEQACENKNEEIAQYLFSLKKELLFKPENIDLLKNIFQSAYNHQSKLTTFIYNQATIEIQSQLNTCLTDYESDPLINITEITQVKELIKKAAETNDLIMMKNIYNTQNPKFSVPFGGLLNQPNIMEDAFIIAAKKSNIDVVKYLLESLPRCVGQIRPNVLRDAIKYNLNHTQNNDFQLIRCLSRHRFRTTIKILREIFNTSNNDSILKTKSQELITACSKECGNSINFVLIGLGKLKLASADVGNIIFQFSDHSNICADHTSFSKLLFNAIPRLHSSYQERRNASSNNEVPRLLDREQSAIGQSL